MTDFHGTRFEKGVVVSGHRLASREAVSVFCNGGNAVDAAVAAAFVLTVVCPYATSLAGDVYMLIYDARTAFSNHTTKSSPSHPKPGTN